MHQPHFWLRVFCLGAVGLLCEAVPARTQTQDIVSGPGSGLVHPGKPLSIREIHKRLERVIETKDLQTPRPLKDALKFLEDKLSDHGKKNLRIVLHDRAFKKEAPDVATTEVRLPPVPKRMSMAMALRILISKVATDNVTYRLRAGQIQITTLDDADPARLSEPVQGLYKDRPLAEVLNELAEQSGVTIILIAA